MDQVKLQIKHLVKEPTACSARDRFSHPAFKRKVPKGIVPCDYDKTEKLIEIELSDGGRHWFKLNSFFGKVIGEAKDIFILYPDGNTEHLKIVGFDLFKEKRTTYWNLIFERELAFLSCKENT